MVNTEVIEIKKKVWTKAMAFEINNKKQGSNKLFWRFDKIC